MKAKHQGRQKVSSALCDIWNESGFPKLQQTRGRHRLSMGGGERSTFKKSSWHIVLTMLVVISLLIGCRMPISFMRSFYMVMKTVSKDMSVTSQYM